MRTRAPLILLAVFTACAHVDTFWVDEGPATAPPGASTALEAIRVAVAEGRVEGELEVWVVRVVRFPAAAPLCQVEFEQNLKWRLGDKLLAPVDAAGCLLLAPLAIPAGVMLAVGAVAEGHAEGLLGLLAGPAFVALGAGYLVSFVAFPFPLYPFTAPLPLEDDPLRFDFVRTGNERVGETVAPAGEYSLDPIGNVRARLLLGADGESGEIGIGDGLDVIRLPRGVERSEGHNIQVEVTTDAGTVVRPATILRSGTTEGDVFGPGGVLPPRVPGSRRCGSTSGSRPASSRSEPPGYTADARCRFTTGPTPASPRRIESAPPPRSMP